MGQWLQIWILEPDLWFCHSVAKLCPTLCNFMHTWMTAACHASLSFTIFWSFLKFCPLSPWSYLTISFSAAHFSFCFQSFWASRSFPIFSLHQVAKVLELQLQQILPMNIQGWFPLELIGLIYLLSKVLSRVFSNTTVWKHQFFSTQPYFFREKALWSLSPHLLIPSHWGVSISHTNFEGHTKFNLYHHVKEENHKKYKFYITLFKN